MAALVLLLGLAGTAFGQTAPGPTGAPAPVVPDVMESGSDLAYCLSDNQFSEGPDASQTFSGKPIGQWIAQVQQGFSMPVSAFKASVSHDGQRLAVEFAGCHPSERLPFTVFAVIDPHGRVSWLGDQAHQYFDGVYAGNFFYVYRLFGWLADSRTILLYAPPYKLGLGGSIAGTSWESFGPDGQSKAAFWTSNGFAPARGNSVLFYVGPGGFGHQLQNEIHEVEPATGKDTTLYTSSEDVNFEIVGLSQMPDGAIEVRYRTYDGAEGKLTVP